MYNLQPFQFMSNHEKKYRRKKILEKAKLTIQIPQNKSLWVQNKARFTRTQLETWYLLHSRVKSWAFLPILFCDGNIRKSQSRSRYSPATSKGVLVQNFSPHKTIRKIWRPRRCQQETLWKWQYCAKSAVRTQNCAHPQSAIRYPLPATRYPLPATRYPLSATRFPAAMTPYFKFQRRKVKSDFSSRIVCQRARMASASKCQKSAERRSVFTRSVGCNKEETQEESGGTENASGELPHCRSRDD